MCRRWRRAVGARADAMLYLAANGDPAVSAERPAWDLESNTLSLITASSTARRLTSSTCRLARCTTVRSGPCRRVLPCRRDCPTRSRSWPPSTTCDSSPNGGNTVTSAINVRFFGAYGPYEAPRKITTRWLQAMAGGQRDFVVRGDGENLIDFMYVDDAVDGFLELVKAFGTTTDGGLRIGRSRERQSGRAGDGADARRRRHPASRRAGGGVHRIPLGRSHDARTVRGGSLGVVRGRIATVVRFPRGGAPCVASVPVPESWLAPQA